MEEDKILKLLAEGLGTSSENVVAEEAVAEEKTADNLVPMPQLGPTPLQMKEVTAPQVKGPYFKVEKKQVPGYRYGQLMGLVDRFNTRGAIKVIGTYLPTPRDHGFSTHIHYLGGFIDPKYHPVVVHMKIDQSEGNALMWKLTNPKGQPWRHHKTWSVMDLGSVLLDTDDPQYEAIKNFVAHAGIVYKKGMSPAQDRRDFIGVLDAAGISSQQLKDGLKH